METASRIIASIIGVAAGIGLIWTLVEGVIKIIKHSMRKKK